jgi:RNA-dependent RNA polymerase
LNDLGVGFRTTLPKEQVVARHCYALAFEKEYVEDWDQPLRAGKWYHKLDEDDGDELRLL